METLTGVCFNPGSNLASTNIVEKGDILTENGSEVGFAETLCANFGSVSPNGHEDDVRDEHGDTWEEVE